MKRTTKSWMRLAANLAVIGAIALIVAMAANGWELSALGSGEYDTTEYEIHEEFQRVSIQSDTEDIAFVPSEDGKCRVVFYEQEKVQHTAAVQDQIRADGIDHVAGRDCQIMAGTVHGFHSHGILFFQRFFQLFAAENAVLNSIGHQTLPAP